MVERRTSDPAEAGGDLYSVGDIAEATGIAPATLRVWERRYGYPIPIRLPSGHRRYTGDQLRRLIRIAEALARGHRVGSLLGVSDGELDRLLDATRPPCPHSEHTDAWLDMVIGLRTSELRANLTAAAVGAAPLAFLEGELIPLLHEVGHAWAKGRVEVRHEHLVTEVVKGVLHGLRARIAERGGASRGRMILATLPGELHGLGLYMAAVLAEDAGVECHVLGPDTPADEIVAAARDLGAGAAALSVSLSGGGVDTDRVIAGLRDALPEGTELIVGGGGSRRPRRGARGVHYFETLREFDAWLRHDSRFGAPGGGTGAP